MAGKTFPGMGELEEQPTDPADAADSGATPAPSGPFYSGPTVVDDVKVEEGLQKLRALDVPPAAVTGAIDTAAEIVESGGQQTPPHGPSPGKASLRAPLKDGGRGTYIGHSVTDVVPPPAEPEKPYDDRMRGTLFGHMLHLPELKLPPAEEPSSRELTIVDQSAPTGHALDIYRPEVARRAAAAIPQEAEAFPRSDRYPSIPIEVDSGPHKKIVLRAGIAAAAIAAIVGAAIIWLHTSTEEPELQGRPAATAAQPATPESPPIAPAAAPAQPPPPPTANKGPEPAAAAEWPAARTDIKEPHEAVRPTTERARSVGRSAAPPTPAGVARPEHHRSSSSPAADAPAKTRPAKRPSTVDDPDGTLAPSIE
ncbi:MAG TPA: hypothetical protein VHH90_03095 [Polyangia bacterium]|nr:hypothetical protein [Polyangia bacterium]